MFILSHGLSVRDSRYKQKACRDGWKRKENKEYIYLYIDKEIASTRSSILRWKEEKREKIQGLIDR